MPRSLEAVGTTLAERLRGGSGPAAALADRGAETIIPVLSPLAPLFADGGLRRGSTAAVHGSASLLLALLAGASQAGSWCAAVGLPTLCAVAAAEAGVAVERLAFVPSPGPDLASVIAALVDGVDIVAVGEPARLHVAEVRRLVARARQRGAVLIGFGGWHGADVRLSVTAGAWHGLGQGHGHLSARQATVRLEGRGSAARPRHVEVWLPAVGGGIATRESAAFGPDPRSGSLGPDLRDRLDPGWPHQAEAG